MAETVAGRQNTENQPQLRLRGPAALARPAEKPKDFSGTVKRLSLYIMPQKNRLLAAGLLSIASTVIYVVGPKVMGKATTKLAEGVLAKYAYYMQLYSAIHNNMPLAYINQLRHRPIPSFDFGYIGRILLIMTLLYIISALLRYATAYIMASVSQETVFQMRNDVKDKLDRLPLSYFDQRTHGEVLSRVTNDMDNIATTLQQSLTQLLTSLLTVVGILIMMLSISPLMTLIALFTLPASSMFTAVITRYSQRFFLQQQICIGELNGHIEEMCSGHKIVKAFGKEDDSVTKFRGINSRLYGVGWKAQFISGIIYPALSFVNNVGYVIACVGGGILVARRAIEIGDIQAFIQYMRQFTQPIIQVASITNILQSTVASAERVFEILDEEEERPDSEATAVVRSPQGHIRFEDVCFSYKPDRPLIQGLNLNVEAGQTVAIVGPTGAGKTTLVNLLMAFYEVQDGRITVDGVDIRDMTRRDLRAMFGMVLQDTWLFTGSIKENIAYGREGCGEKEIIEAARAAHAHHFITTLPAGYDTILNEEASNISQGQKQLLTIARAILADRPILILDEATSNVDTRTEVLIQQAMANLMKGRTCFVIAHRLSTIRDADLILVMNHGSIIEQGSHKELMAKDGFYAELYRSQFMGVK